MTTSEFGFGTWRDGRFATTRWSAVVAAANESPEKARSALASLCELYWYSIYVFIRRRGHSSEDAFDLTQSFFVHLIEKQTLERADPRRGKFRSFLLTCVKNFLANERDRATAKKRGGGQRIVSIDAGGAEERYRLEPVETQTAESFSRQMNAVIAKSAVAHLGTFLAMAAGAGLVVLGIVELTGRVRKRHGPVAGTSM